MRAVFGSVISLFFLVHTATAATVSFSGSVSGSTTSDFSVGDEITARFEVDAATPLFDFTTVAAYSISSFTVSVGDSFSASTSGSGTVFVNNMSTFDDVNFQISERFNGAVAGTTLVPSFFQLRLFTSDTSTLSSTTFPTSIDIADYSSTNWTLRFGDGLPQVVGTMEPAPDAPELSAVPLPAGLPLLALGLCAFGFVRRRS